MLRKRLKKPKDKTKTRTRNGTRALSKNGVLENTYARKWRRLSLRTRIYTFACVFAVFAFVILPTTSSAFTDMFGFGIHDLYANITVNVRETNEILSHAFTFARTSPYDVVNGLAGTDQENILIAIRNAVIAVALTVATLLLMVDFFRKTINFEFASKWENILVFLVKIIVVKQVVQNSDEVVAMIYQGFDSINRAALDNLEDIDFLPYGTAQRYTMPIHWYEQMASDIFSSWRNFFQTGIFQFDENNPPIYEISLEAVQIFYPGARDTSTNLSISGFQNPTTASTFSPTVELILLQPYFLALKVIAVVIFVTVIGRVFELALYTIFAPLPLATFASDVSNDVGKNFIKSYIAVVLQIAVIIVMFIVFVAMQRYFTNLTESTGAVQTTLIRFVVLISLGLGVVKSGAWAKKIVGMG